MSEEAERCEHPRLMDAGNGWLVCADCQSYTRDFMYPDAVLYECPHPESRRWKDQDGRVYCLDCKVWLR